MYYETKYGISVQEVLPYLSLPSVQILEGTHIMEDGFTNAEGKHAFLADEVHFRYNALDSNSMTNFLKCFTLLRSFAAARRHLDHRHVIWVA